MLVVAEVCGAYLIVYWRELEVSVCDEFHENPWLIQSYHCGAHVKNQRH